MEEDAEIIFESWLFKLQGSPEGRGAFLSSSWKKRYFILFRERENAFLQYHDRKPKSLTDVKRERISLQPSYTIEKCRKIRGRENVCLLTTSNGRSYYLAAEDQKILHLFVFFVQTQTRLKEELEPECFVVRPETSDDHRRLGARGSMCILHLSRWGITLALQLSKCVLAQWPLNCIKSYETTGRGHFGIEAGKGSLCGQGNYVFNTRIGQENIIYDTLDNYVNELSGLRQMVSARGSSTSDLLEGLSSQLSCLQGLTVTHSDARFIPHLKKISRDIYDHLSDYLGGTTATRLNISSPDLLSDSRQNLSRSGSQVTVLDENTLRKQSITTLPSSHQYSNEDRPNEMHERAASSLTSTYLHMGSPPAGAEASRPAAEVSRDRPPMMRRISKRTPTRRMSDSDPDLHSHAEECRRVSERFSDRFSGLRPRLRSRSADDLNEYTSCSQLNESHEEVFVYENKSYVCSEDRSPNREYCYPDSASARHMRRSLSNPDLLNDTEWPRNRRPPKLDFTSLQRRPPNGMTSNRSSGASQVRTPGVKSPLTPLTQGISASPSTRVFTRTKNPPTLTVLRQESGIMQGRQLPSIPLLDQSNGRMPQASGANNVNSETLC